jgi:N-acetylneuraminic acid mutarotase
MPMKPQRNHWVIFILLLIGSGCVDSPPEPLAFSEIKTLSIEVGAVLGDIIVKGELLEAELSSVTEYGVLWSSSLGRLESGTGFKVQKATTPLSSPSFPVSIRNIGLDSTYYFRTYAKVAGGRMVLGNIIPFSFAVSLEVLSHRQLNDTLFLTARLAGLSRFAPLLPQITELGMVMETQNQAKIQEKIRPTGPVGDNIYSFKMDSVLFNTSYKLRFYVISGQKQWESPEYALVTGGGWRKLNNLSAPLFGVAAASNSNSAFVGFGYRRACEVQDNPSYSTYNPTTESFSPLRSSVFAYNRQYASAFVLNENFYFGLGENIETACNPGFMCDVFSYNPQSGAFTAVSECFPGSTRSRAAAFVLNGKAYLGLGYRAGFSSTRYFDDFWEYSPSAANTPGTWRAVEPLPIKKGSATESNGRQFPFVFNLSNRVFVGGGSLGAQYLNDIWEFSPPKNQSDKGTWNYHGAFPGLSRDEAFSLSLNGKGYLGLGFHDQQGVLNDFWVFDPTASPDKQWRRLEDFPGEKRGSAIAFTLNGQIYVGGGLGKKAGPNAFVTTYPTDFWVYTPTK